MNLKRLPDCPLNLTNHPQNIQQTILKLNYISMDIYSRLMKNFKFFYHHHYPLDKGCPCMSSKYIFISINLFQHNCIPEITLNTSST